MRKLTPEERSEVLLGNIDTSDCGVIAIQAVTSLRRADAERACERYGYHSGVGMDRAGQIGLLVKLGYSVELIEPDLGDTPATFAMTHDRGTYLLWTDGHVQTLKEGDLYNAVFSERLEVAAKITKVG